MISLRDRALKLIGLRGWFKHGDEVCQELELTPGPNIVRSLEPTRLNTTAARVTLVLRHLDIAAPARRGREAQPRHHSATPAAPRTPRGGCAWELLPGLPHGQEQTSSPGAALRMYEIRRM